MLCVQKFVGLNGNINHIFLPIRISSEYHEIFQDVIILHKSEDIGMIFREECRNALSALGYSPFMPPTIKVKSVLLLRYLDYLIYLD